MKNSPGRVPVSALLLVSVVGCTPVMQEAILRGVSGAYYQRSRNPYVSPLGRASESFAAGFFGALADTAREQRLANEFYERERRLGQELYVYDGPSPQRESTLQRQPEMPREKIIKARVEIEEFLKADRDNFSQWINHLPNWIEELEKYGARESRPPHYLLSKELYENTRMVDSRASFYLGSLPAYVHENMDVEKVRTEIQDYLSKRENVIAMQKKWNDDINVVLVEAEKEREHLKKIEAEQKRF